MVQLFIDLITQNLLSHVGSRELSRATCHQLPGAAAVEWRRRRIKHAPAHPVLLPALPCCACAQGDALHPQRQHEVGLRVFCAGACEAYGMGPAIVGRLRAFRFVLPGPGAQRLRGLNSLNSCISDDKHQSEHMPLTLRTTACMRIAL